MTDWRSPQTPAQSLEGAGLALPDAIGWLAEAGRDRRDALPSHEAELQELTVAGWQRGERARHSFALFPLDQGFQRGRIGCAEIHRIWRRTAVARATAVLIGDHMSGDAVCERLERNPEGHPTVADCGERPAQALLHDVPRFVAVAKGTQRDDLQTRRDRRRESQRQGVRHRQTGEALGTIQAPSSLAKIHLPTNLALGGRP